jgi:hypothetical protein
MNTGVGDAIDLSWKLAGTIHGWGGPGLLDSYEPERRRVGARNVEAAGRASAVMGMWRALVTPEITADTPEGAALREKVGAAADQHHRRIYAMTGVKLGYTYAGSGLIAHEPDNASDWETTVYTPHTRPRRAHPAHLAEGRPCDAGRARPGLHAHRPDRRPGYRAAACRVPAAWGTAVGSCRPLSRTCATCTGARCCWCGPTCISSGAARASRTTAPHRAWGRPAA